MIAGTIFRGFTALSTFAYAKEVVCLPGSRCVLASGNTRDSAPPTWLYMQMQTRLVAEYFMKTKDGASPFTSFVVKGGSVHPIPFCSSLLVITSHPSICCLRCFSNLHKGSRAGSSCVVKCSDIT